MIAAAVAMIMAVLGSFNGAGTPATMARWVDGDTAHVIVAGDDVTVRLLGVDSPEFQSYNGRNECVSKPKAAAAAARAKQLAPVGRLVWLDGDGTDRYRRRLSTITANGADVGATLVAEGLARSWPNGACV